jgi:hypothetical protein
VVFAADPARWTPDSRSVAVASADELGRFEVHGLPAGRYLAVALENESPQSEVTDPAFLYGLRTDATELTLGERDSRVVTLPFTSR